MRLPYNQLPQVEQVKIGGLGRASQSRIILLANRSEITQNELIMKPYSLLVAMMITAITCVSSFAQDKTILGVLQSNTGKTIELRMQCGEKIGGKVEQVNDNVVLLSHLTGAEYFDGVVNLKDISAVITRSAGK